MNPSYLNALLVLTFWLCCHTFLAYGSKIDHSLHSHSKKSLRRRLDSQWSSGSVGKCSHHLCTSSGLTWELPKFYNNVSACALLAEKGIRNVYFSGDSFLRHLSQAMEMTLSGFTRGLIVPVQSKCIDDLQFDEKDCMETDIIHFERLCGGNVTNSYDNRLPMDPLDGYSYVKEMHTPDNLIVFSMGNHQLFHFENSPWIDDTINNATEHIKYLQNTSFCYPSRTFTHRIAWISTHYRIDEYPEGPQTHRDVENFNNGMKDFFVNKHGCGPDIEYVDVYNMTKSLVLNHFDESLRMTHDRMHWSRNVNLIKIQILLNEISKWKSVL